MANVTITAASIAPITSNPPNTTIGQGTAGATITQGQELYMDVNSSNQLKPADCTTAAKAASVGTALNAASSGQPVFYATGGDVTYGSGLTKGTVYVLSATANGGNICPFADLIAGNFVTILGVATSTSVLRRGAGPTASGQTI